MFPVTQSPTTSTTKKPLEIKEDDSQKSEYEQAEVYVDPLKDDPELQRALMSLLADFDRLEESNRNVNVRIWKKCENYWHHIQNQYWSEYAQDWRSPTDFYKTNPDVEPIALEELKIVNIYRAHGESIVAALSVNTPNVRFFPNDADEAADIVTSKAFSKIAKMIERQNNSKLLLMRMVYILFNQGFVAVHNYSHESEEYGVVQVPQYDKKKVYFTTSYCPVCGEELHQFGPFEKEQKPEDTGMQEVCPACENEVSPELVTEERETNFIKDYDEKPKCRQKLAVYGPLNIKVSSYAYDQKSLGILVFDAEQDIAKAQEMYPDIAEELRSGPLTNELTVQARMPNNMFDSYNKMNVTVRQVWLRPWMYNKIAITGNPHEDARVKKLKKLFPDGLCFHAVNDKYAESHRENLDSAWSLSFNPLSRYIHGDPIGFGLLPIQDMKNELVNLQLEGVEYGIPETFVDPEVLDLEQYAKAKGGPGMVFPTKPVIPGGDISKSFYTNKTATLSDEAGRLEARVDESAQFITGDYPSIYGGPNSGDTAAEYSMSRQQALQRLSTTWTIINFLWADVMKRSTEGYVSNLEEDEKYVTSVGEADYINVWIKKDELQGSIGEVYPEASEQFPLSWSAQREIILSLIQQQNPMLEAVIADPNNRVLIASLIGLPELYIPGEIDRIKQLGEISKLIQAEPIGPQQSSIPIEPELDDDVEHIATCKYWCNSEVGQYYKENKPSAYMNVMLHMEEHQMHESMIMQQSMENTNNDQNTSEGSNSSNQSSNGPSNGALPS
jgi:hypothetical protein